MEEWQVAIIEMRQDLRKALQDSSKFKERLVFILLGAVFILAGLNQVGVSL